MNDPTDHATVVNPFHSANICRQMRFNSSPLLVAQPKQVPAHDPDPLSKPNQERIVASEKLMSFDPS
jgi:hypothetical protein